MAELVDASVSKTDGSDIVSVRFRPWGLDCMKSLLAKDLYKYIFSQLETIYEDVYERKSISNIIFSHITKCGEVDLLLNVEIEFEDYPTLEYIFCRLKKHEPIQYVLNTTTFHGIDFYVDENVFIPRPATEEMVDDIINNISLNGKNVLDLCTGSGCIPIVIKNRYPEANVYGIDINPQALEVAKKNARANTVDITFLCQDIFSDKIYSFFSTEKMDIIVSNPPYVCEKEKKNMMPRVLDYEPHDAIFVSDDDPIKFYKRISALSEKMLKNKGDVYVEINPKFKNEVKGLFKNYTCCEDKKECDMYRSYILHFRKDT